MSDKKDPAIEWAINKTNQEYIENIIPIDGLEKKIVHNLREISQYLVQSQTRNHCILISSFLDDSLKELFSERWGIKSSKDKQKYFNPGGPLDTVNSRLLVAKGIGWIEGETLEESNNLRKIRNIFAHSHVDHILSGGNVRPLIDKIHPYEYRMNDDEEFKEHIESTDEEDRFRIRYHSSCSNIVMIAVSRSKKIYNRIPPNWKTSGYEGFSDFEKGIINCILTFQKSVTGMT
jgi:hypothetical protein